MHDRYYLETDLLIPRVITVEVIERLDADHVRVREVNTNCVGFFTAGRFLADSPEDAVRAKRKELHALVESLQQDIADSKLRLTHIERLLGEHPC